MSKRALGTAVVTVVLAMSALVVGCKSKQKLPEGYERSDYITYVDEVSGEKFLVPKGMKIFPPIVNPKTGKRTLIRAHVFKPKDNSPPRAFWYDKFTDAQIKAMEEYAKNTKPEMLQDMPPDAWLSGENQGAMIKAEGGKWISYQEQLMGRGIPDYRKETKSFFEQTPKDWGEKLTEDQVKQW